jgi:hypothetical protein
VRQINALTARAVTLRRKKYRRRREASVQIAAGRYASTHLFLAQGILWAIIEIVHIIAT